MKRTTYLFRELGVFAATAAVLLAAWGREVRYLRLTGRLASDRGAALLASLGVRALSYEEVPDGIGKYFRRVADASARLYREVFQGCAVERAIADDLGMGADDRERFSLACEHYLLSDLGEPCELLLFAGEMAAVNPTVRIRVVTVGNRLSRILVAWEREAGGDIELLPLPQPHLLDYLRNGWRKYRKVMTGAFATHGGSTQAADAPAALSQEVIFFPHKGIYYSNLFVRDHYYAAEPESPFHPSRILHLSLGERPEEREPASERYYREHGIPHADLNALGGAQPFRWAADFAALLWRKRRPWLVDAGRRGIGHIAFYFARYCHLRLYLGGLAHLPRARVALVGYDILFPPMLAVALAMRGVASVATQERFFAPFQGIYRLIFDHYLPVGARICRFVAENPRLAKIGRCDPIGPVRAEDILACQPPFPEKYQRIKREHYLILALDFYSATTAVDNARAMANHWQGNKRFYLDMIRLAIDLPRAHIVLKGKDSVATGLPVMTDVMAVIDMLPNLSFETDLDNHSPALMAAMADLTIGCHTSLIDEVLAIGRPALTYDCVGHPTAFFDYDGYPMIVRTYDDLRARVGALMAGAPLMDAARFAQMRSDFYSADDSGVSPRRKLRLQLDRIYEETVQRTVTQEKPHG